MKLLTYLITVLCFYSLQAQDLNKATQELAVRSATNDPMRPFSHYMYSFDTRYKETIGTPFFNENWSLGEVVDKNKYVWKNIWIKYDVFADELMVKTANGDSIVVKSSAIESFNLSVNLQNYKFVVMKLKDFAINKTNKNEGYFQSFYNGKTIAYLRHRVSLIKGEESSTYVTNTSNKFVKDSPIFYIQKKGELPLKVSRNKKSFLKVLNDKEVQLKSYIDTEKIDFTKDADIIKLLTYYDSLSQ